jgi:uncharacterized protein YneF (UPF0154 family)
MKIMRNKKGAMEMSIGTLVTIVLLMAVLILGLFLVRKVMCSGIIVTDQIHEATVNELKDLFSINDYGIKCMGEKGQDVKLGDGGKRQIVCVTNMKEQTRVNLNMNKLESLKGAKTEVVNGWILDKDWSGTLSPGGDVLPVLVLDIPEDVSETNLKIEIEEENLDTGTKKTHISYVDIAHVSGLSASVC